MADEVRQAAASIVIAADQYAAVTADVEMAPTNGGDAECMTKVQAQCRTQLGGAISTLARLAGYHWRLEDFDG